MRTRAAPLDTKPIDAMGFTLEQAGIDLAFHAQPNLHFEDPRSMVRQAAGDRLHDIFTYQRAVTE